MTSETISADGTVNNALRPLTKSVIAEIMAEMRLMGGAPASGRMKEIYITRLNGLLKRGVLEVIDNPREFESRMNVQEKSACSTVAYLKVVNQYMQTLLQTGQWITFYKGDFDSAAASYRRLGQDLNAREKIEAAGRRKAKEAANKEVDQVRLVTKN